jgi:hypothetical protein
MKFSELTVSSVRKSRGQGYLAVGQFILRWPVYPGPLLNSKEDGHLGIDVHRVVLLCPSFPVVHAWAGVVSAGGSASSLSAACR